MSYRPITRQFLNLQAEWYKRLAESGFKDIEDYSAKYGNHHLPFITRSCNDLAKKYSQDTFNYYQSCRDFLISGIIASKIDETIWEMHSNGESLREISNNLKAIGTFRSYFWVYEQVKRLKSDLRAYVIAKGDDSER